MTVRQILRAKLMALPKEELRAKKGLRFLVSQELVQRYIDELGYPGVGCCVDPDAPPMYSGVQIYGSREISDDTVLVARVVE